MSGENAITQVRTRKPRFREVSLFAPESQQQGGKYHLCDKFQSGGLLSH